MSHPNSHPTDTPAETRPVRKRHPKARVERDRDHHLQNREGWWYFVMEWRGKRIRRACQTTDAAAARELRDRWMDEVWRDGMLPSASPVRQVTVGELLAVYEAGPLESSSAHRHRVANIVRSMLREAFPGRDVDRTAAVEALTDSTLGAWRRWWLGRVQAAEEAEGQAAGARLKASGNSLLNQAAALFSADACQLFKDQGLAVPMAADWRAACRARGFKVASARARFIAPAESVVAAIFAGLSGLLDSGPVQPATENTTPAEVQRRNLALACAFALGGGLRKGEITQLRWEWVSDRETDWLVDGEADVKDGAGRLRQRIHGWALDLAGVRGLRRSAGPVLEGHDTERAEMVFRRLSHWMRALGWEAPKTAHGLRDLAISCVIAETGSAWEGQGFARHSSVTVTESHYGHFAREAWLRELVAKAKAPRPI